MSTGKIFVVGLGPGDEKYVSQAAIEAMKTSDVIVGYKYYFEFVKPFITDKQECVDTGMRKERERANYAFERAEEGKTVCVVSSGDAGIYGMSPLIWEMKKVRKSDIEIEVIPGISAFQMASARLGAPTGHDFCVISLSDLMTSWEIIEKRIFAAAEADFITSIYNPKSVGRYWQLNRLQEIFLKYRDPKTPVGYVRQAGRPEEEIFVTTLEDFNPEEVDMFTIVIIGNSRTYQFKDKMITPRGYYNEDGERGVKAGQAIMIKSFQTIESKLKNQDLPLDIKWPLIHCIHTTADFDMENVFYADNEAMKVWHDKFESGNPPVIVTDVSMAASGIRKAAIERLGLKVKCYLSDDRVKDLAEQKGITRTQAGIRLAVEEHPDALFVFGNAPTALIELTDLMRKGKANPVGVVAAPVGFVNVQESKHRLKVFKNVPKVIIDGRKGGSNLAATIVNSALAFNDAEILRPGREV